MQKPTPAPATWHPSTVGTQRQLRVLTAAMPARFTFAVTGHRQQTRNGQQMRERERVTQKEKKRNKQAKDTQCSAHGALIFSCVALPSNQGQHASSLWLQRCRLCRKASGVCNHRFGAWLIVWLFGWLALCWITVSQTHLRFECLDDLFVPCHSAAAPRIFQRSPPRPRICGL